MQVSTFYRPSWQVLKIPPTVAATKNSTLRCECRSTAYSLAISSDLLISGIIWLLLLTDLCVFRSAAATDSTSSRDYHTSSITYLVIVMAIAIMKRNSRLQLRQLSFIQQHCSTTKLYAAQQLHRHSTLFRQFLADEWSTISPRLPPPRRTSGLHISRLAWRHKYVNVAVSDWCSAPSLWSQHAKNRNSSDRLEASAAIWRWNLCSPSSSSLHGTLIWFLSTLNTQYHASYVTL